MPLSRHLVFPDSPRPQRSLLSHLFLWTALFLITICTSVDIPAGGVAIYVEQVLSSMFVSLQLYKAVFVFPLSLFGSSWVLIACQPYSQLHCNFFKGRTFSVCSLLRCAVPHLPQETGPCLLCSPLYPTLSLKQCSWRNKQKEWVQ